MHPFLLTHLAQELARDRLREAADNRLAEEARRSNHHDRPHPPAGPIRRFLARGAAAVSRSTAGIARRLDERTADELAARVTGSSAAA